MRKLENLKTKIFLDSGDPNETRKVIEILGFLDGQTTNPSLIAKNPSVMNKFNANHKFSNEELLNEYKKIVQEISELIPNGSVSIEVYADKNTKSDEMITQSFELNSWIPNAHIKLPITKEGLIAEHELIKQGININMTLVFSQEQAAAVHLAAGEFREGQLFVSPFAGRLNDHCRDGMDLISNIQKMYRENNSKAKVLAASIRDLNHLLYCLYSEVDIMTVPFKVLEEWSILGCPLPGIDIDLDEFKNQNEFFSETRDVCIIDIGYKNLDLNKNWEEFDIEHELTDEGISKFAEDWNKLIKV